MTQLFIPGTALPSQVLLNQLFSAGINYNVPGTMPNNGALNQSLAINGTYTIPVGYTTGGSVTQSIPTKTAQTYTPGTTDQTIAAAQYLSGVQTIKGDANLVPANIVGTIFGVVGTVVPVTFSVGDNAVAVDTASQSATNSGSVKSKRYTMNYTGSVRIKYSLYSSGGTSTGRVFKNGVQVGVDDTTGNGLTITHSQDFTCSVGDYFDVYAIAPVSGTATMAWSEVCIAMAIVPMS